jgi:hypothetical protein
MAVLPLTTLAAAKVYANILGDRPGVDAILSAMILSVSQRLEQYCSRGFLVESATECRVLRGALVPVFRGPIKSIESVRAAISGRRADLQSLSASQYEISADGKSVRVWDMPDGSLVEITYTGGLAEDAAGIVASHPVLQEACLLQVANLWQRHDKADPPDATRGGTSPEDDMAGKCRGAMMFPGKLAACRGFDLAPEAG